MEATHRQPFNAAQIELLTAMGSLKTESDLRELKLAMSKFFAERADRELQRLMDQGVVNDETIANWEHEHMRTPYAQMV